jgi:chromate transport protein ChrA
VSEKFQHIEQTAKHVGDITAVGVTVATVVQWLPAAAALLTIIWTAIRIYETETVQGWINGRKKP